MPFKFDHKMVVFVGPVIVSLLFLLHQVESNCESFIDLESTGSFYKREEFSFNIPEATKSGWEVEITFDNNVSALIGNSGVIDQEQEECNKNVCSFKNVYANRNLEKDKKLILSYKVKYSGSKAPKVTKFKFNGKNICSSGSDSITEKTTNSASDSNITKSDLVGQ